MMPHCNVDITDHHLTLSALWRQFTKILSKTSDLVFRPVSIDNLKHILGIFLFWGILSIFSVNSLAITIQSVRRAAYSFVFVVFFASILVCPSVFVVFQGQNTAQVVTWGRTDGLTGGNWLWSTRLSTPLRRHRSPVGLNEIQTQIQIQIQMQKRNHSI